MYITNKPFIIGVVVILFGTFATTYFNLYDFIPYLDKYSHFAGGFIIAWFFGKLWKEKLKSFNNFERLLILLGMAMTVGVLWEVMEFVGSSNLFDNNPLIQKYIYTGGVADTIADLVTDMLGGIVFSLISRPKS